jgi:ribosomal subunit interface protein
MTRQQLFENIKKKQSFLCIGLDSDITKLPKGIPATAEGIFEFNKQIIDATHDLCVAYKPNSAFYESLGSKGWEALEKTIAYLNKKCPDVFTIADAKRGDIGNTSKLYARAFFEQMNFDAITVAPYMGEDSVTPFLEYKNKWVILLALTSNKGADDFQTSELALGKTMSPFEGGPHFSMSTDLTDFTNEHVNKLGHFNDTIIDADVCLKLDKSDTTENKVCEIRLLVSGNDLFAKKQSHTFEEAIKQTTAALKEQIRKQKVN